LPKEEQFGLISQMRRAAVSVPANVAEGIGRGRNAEFIRHLEIAWASLFELQTHALLAQELGWVQPGLYGDFNSLSEEVDRVISGLLRGLRRRGARV